MKYRITDEMYNKIFNNPSELDNLNGLSFDLMIDLYSDLLDNVKIPSAISISNKKELIVYGFINYLFKLVNTYCMFISGSHKVGAKILERTITEMHIKIMFLLEKNEQKLYEDFMLDSLISEKFYLEKLDLYREDDPKFVHGTEISIEKLMASTGVDDLSNLSRKKIEFPRIEDMTKYLIDNEKISPAIYDIVYRNASSYTHATWSALENELRNIGEEYVDMRLIAPFSVQIISLIIYINDKLEICDDEFIKKLKIYDDAFENLDRTFINRYWYNK